jgi:hypothetical protein
MKRKERKKEHRLVSFGSSFSSAVQRRNTPCSRAPRYMPFSGSSRFCSVHGALCCCCCSYYYSTLPIKNPRESHQLVRPNSLGSELRHKWRSVGYIDNMYVYISIFSFFLSSPSSRKEEEGGERDLVFPWHFPPYNNNQK